MFEILCLDGVIEENRLGISGVGKNIDLMLMAADSKCFCLKNDLGILNQTKVKEI
mgnify:CR=1 FL=1